MSGNQLVDANGARVRLVGTNYGDHPQAFVGSWTRDASGVYTGQPAGPCGDGAKIKGQGFNGVNLVAEWGWLETSSTYNVFQYNNPPSADRGLPVLKKIVDCLTAPPNGLFVIIKLHADADCRNYLPGAPDSQLDCTTDWTNLNAFLNSAPALGTQYCTAKPTSRFTEDFRTAMTDSFYKTPASPGYSDGNGMDHLIRLWREISNLFATNNMVVGYDLLNEPTRPRSNNGDAPRCNTQTALPGDIVQAYQSRVSDIISILRSVNPSHPVTDNHVVVVQPAPFFEYNAIQSNLIAFSDPNQMLSYHWYRDVYPTSSGSWTACSDDLVTLDGMWDNKDGAVCYPDPSHPTVPCYPAGSCGTTSFQLLQLQQKFPNEAISIGEVGDIYQNSPGDINQRWNLKSIQILLNHNSVAYFYYGEKDCGPCTWTSDLGRTPVWPFASCLSATTVTSTQVSLSWSSAIASPQTTSGVTYKVYRDNSANPISSLTTNTTTDSPPAGTSTHTYQVQAVDSNNFLTVTGPATTVNMPSSTATDFNLVTNSACPRVYGTTGGSYRGDASSLITISSFNWLSSQITLSSTVSPSGPIVGLGASSVWPSPNGNAVVSMDAYIPGSLGAGKYDVTVTGTCGTCSPSSSRSVTVSVYLAPDFGFLTQNGWAPFYLSVPQGNWQSAGIWVNSIAKFAGTVNVALSADPQLSQNGITFDTSLKTINLAASDSVIDNLIVTASSSTPRAEYCCLYVTGTSGALSHTIRVIVTVTTGVTGGSVLRGTLITLANRTQVRVETLNAGMQLRSYDMDNHQFVNTTINRFNSVIVDNYMVIMTTAYWPLITDQNPAQRVYVMFPNATWTLMPVTHLQVGFYLFQPETGTWARITNLYYHTGGSYTMYDIYNTPPGNYIANTYLDPVKQ